MQRIGAVPQVLLIMLLAFASTAHAQIIQYDLCIANQQRVGNQWQFDITIENTSINDLRVGECDFSFNFDKSFFCNNPALSVELAPEFSSTGYNMDIPDVPLPSGVLAVALIAPENIEDTYLIPGNQEIRIATISVSSVCGNNNSYPLDWRVGEMFGTLVHSYDDLSQELEDITAGGEYCVDGRGGQPGPGRVGPMITVSPNPATYAIRVKFDSDSYAYKEFELVFVDINGQEVWREENVQTNGLAETHEIQLQNEHFSAGTYVIRISDAFGKDIGTTKFIVVR